MMQPYLPSLSSQFRRRSEAGEPKINRNPISFFLLHNSIAVVASHMICEPACAPAGAITRRTRFRLFPKREQNENPSRSFHTPEPVELSPRMSTWIGAKRAGRTKRDVSSSSNGGNTVPEVVVELDSHH